MFGLQSLDRYERSSVREGLPLKTRETQETLFYGRLDLCFAPDLEVARYNYLPACVGFVRNRHYYNPKYIHKKHGAPALVDVVKS